MRRFGVMSAAWACCCVCVMAGPGGTGGGIAGIIENRAIDEASGMAGSMKRADVLWVLNDGGGGPILYALGTNAATLCEVRLEDAKNWDWEDLASFHRGGVDYLLIADVGDNGSRRPHCRLFIFEEPPVRNGQGLRPAWTTTFRYEDGPRDCESVTVDTANDRVLLLSKRTQPPVLYSLPLKPDDTSGILLAKRLGEVPSVPLPSSLDGPHQLRRYGRQPVAMDMTPDGRSLVVLTYLDAYLYRRSGEDTWLTALQRTPHTLRLPDPETMIIPKREALCIHPLTGDVYVTSEYAPAQLYRLPAASLGLPGAAR